MTSTPAGSRVRVERYERVHLRPGDQFTLGRALHELTAPVGPRLQVVLPGTEGLAGPGEPARVDTVNIAELPGQVDVVPGPGRTSGLLGAFWHSRIVRPPPAERLDENTLALTNGEAVRLCFGARERRTARRRGALAWLAVAGAGVTLGEYNPSRACWSELSDNLEVAAALDGGLNTAGAAALGYLRLLTDPDTRPPWWDVPTGLWHTALLAHLRLTPDATQVLALLAAEFDGALTDLGILVAELTDAPAQAARP